MNFKDALIYFWWDTQWGKIRRGGEIEYDSVIQCLADREGERERERERERVVVVVVVVSTVEIPLALNSKHKYIL